MKAEAMRSVHAVEGIGLRCASVYSTLDAGRVLVTLALRW